MNDRMYELGNKASVIRELFEYGKKRKKKLGKITFLILALVIPVIPVQMS